MDVVAVLSLGRSADDEAPALAADLGLTIYETALMLRAPMPVIVHRTDDRSRAHDLVARLRARRNDALVLDLEDVIASDRMWTPKAFRFESGDMLGSAAAEERRLPLAGVFAFVRASHMTQTEEVILTRERKVSLTGAVLTGGLPITKVSESESRRFAQEREAVLYVFRGDGAPWLLRAMHLRYDGLAERMRVSQTENFEILLATLRELAPNATFDSRLVSARPWTSKVVAASAKQTTTTSAPTVDILAHVVAAELSRKANPYR
jgi:hypothetical protein